MPFDDDLDDLLAAARADDAARSRAGVGSLRDLAVEDATLPGLLLSCADRSMRVRLGVGTRTVTGIVVDVCDVGVVIASARTVTIVRLDVVDSLTTPCDARPDIDHHPPRRSTFTELLHAFVEYDDLVEVSTRGSAVRGELRSIGRTVISIGHEDRSTTYVDTDSIEVVIVVSSIEPDTDGASPSDPGSIRHERMNASRSERSTRITRPNR